MFVCCRIWSDYFPLWPLRTFLRKSPLSCTSKVAAPHSMSVWGSGDAEYFRAAIFRGSYTFRKARIETFNGHSRCQGAVFFFFSTLPSPVDSFLWSLMMTDLDLPIFKPHILRWGAKGYIFPCKNVIISRTFTVLCHACKWINKTIQISHFQCPPFSWPAKSVLTQWIILPAKQEPGVIVSEVTSIAFALNDLNG